MRLFSLCAAPDYAIDAGDTLPGQTHQKMIARRNIQLLPAAYRPQTDSFNTLIIKLRRLKQRHDRDLPRSPDSKPDIAYHGDLRNWRIFPHHNPVTLSGQPVFPGGLVCRAHDDTIGDKGQRGGLPPGALCGHLLNGTDRQRKTRRQIKAGLRQRREMLAHRFRPIRPAPDEHPCFIQQRGSRLSHHRACNFRPCIYRPHLLLNMIVAQQKQLAL